MRSVTLRLLAATAAVALTTSVGLAADLPSRQPPPPMIAAVPVFTWTGFYVGVNAGYGWNTNNGGSAFVPGVGFIDVGGGNDGGFVGGGQIGYNYQIGSFVIGAEADLQWADLGNNNNNNFVFGNTFIGGGNGLDWFGTVRARAGFAFDRFLVYATGGFAYASGNNNNACFVGGVAFDCGGGGDLTGWTVGGGVEWALPVNWFGSSAVTFGVEGLYVNFDNSNSNTILGNLANVAFDNGRDLEFGVVRAKLNFKF